MLVFRGGNTSTLYESSVGLMGRKNASCFGVELQKRKPEKNANASKWGEGWILKAQDSLFVVFVLEMVGLGSLEGPALGNLI